MEKKKKIVISARNLSKIFTVSDDKTNTVKQILFNILTIRKTKVLFQALKNINLSIYEGDKVAFIGGNGSGKTTLCKILSGIYSSTKGKVVIKGSTIFLNLGIGMNPELTAKENVYLTGLMLGLTIKQIDGLFDELIEYVELQDFVHRKVKYFSSGMVSRLFFSIAVHAKTDIIFLDEILAVGDFSFRNKSIRLFEDVLLKNKTVILVSHNFSEVKQYANKVGYLRKGELVYFGDPETAIQMYIKDEEDKNR